MKRTIPFPARLGIVFLALLLDPDSIYSDQGSEKPALKYEEPVHLAGSIYSLGGKQLLFKFNRTATRSGSSLKIQRDFSYPDGRLATREQVVYEGDALVSYALDELQTGGKGRATIRRPNGVPVRGRIEFEYRAEPSSRTRVRSEELAQNTLIADMVGPFLLSHWAALEKGEKVKCRYIVVPRAETVGFTFSKLSNTDTKIPARNVTIIKMEPTSPFISALVDPLFFTIEQGSPHRVLQYVGRTAPKIQNEGKWKDLDGLTVFDWNSTQSTVDGSTVR